MVIIDSSTALNETLSKIYEHDSLCSYIDQNFNSITWEQKLYIILNISHRLGNIYGKNSIHKNLHLDSGKIYEVMPYMAPEILRGKEYTQKSDVYSFGIIINEIISIIPPFNDEPYDHYLALDIYHGKRPKIRDETTDRVSKRFNSKMLSLQKVIQLLMKFVMKQKFYLQYDGQDLKNYQN
ncbi:kinase-like domain-containing protein [Glomus cerebriforme]|uniref:Kinase-like domain-containing protein n=1 Tax=Glomus cerebriforme TaxID=658196 RepID=A0A397S321_9GLOM|nr:kinase-like domain-containing protein [Glomus cerebriforme]